jgi:lantibiotic leader peptide-processing serine protease
MTRTAGPGSRRARHTLVRWAATFAAALAVAACSDRLPVAPVHAPVAAAPLPPAAHYIIELARPGGVPPAVLAAIQAAGGRVVYAHERTGIVAVARLSASAATALQSEPGVAFVVPDRRLRLINDPPFRRFTAPGLHGLRTAAVTTPRATDPRNAAFFSLQWNMTRIQADTAWQITSQGAGTSVFILDSGIDTAHVELLGLVDLARSTSFAFASGDTLQTMPLPFNHDVAGHGTFVSSIVAGHAVNIAAVAPRATLVMVRVIDDSGSGSTLALLNGLLYAADNGADVINMSLGGYLPRNSPSFLGFADLFQRIIDYAAQRGVLLVAAAGNNAVNTNTATSPTGSFADSLNTPAGLHHVMSVGATGPVDQKNFDQIAAYSNFGKAEVGVFAPGGNTVDTSANGQKDLVIGACSSATSLCPGSENSYLIGAGTSFASPHAAGEAAVVKTQSTTHIAGAALETCVLNTASNVAGKRPDINYNFGRIDVLSAVKSSGCK